ncbi:hypothetical protein [Streptomyces sp. CC224B]|uniref:hypothetical protein n=1 Tax=Streptomyces sp. CC224B TaxID=3044571 RepID=UPI0024A9F274|nr:hypothetical protein [Streptomyces sp. CC224B]
MATATVPAPARDTTSKPVMGDDDTYEGPSRSTVVTVLALLVGVLSLVDYFLHGFGAAAAHLSYFGGVVLVFRVFFSLVFRGADAGPEPEPRP